MNDIDKSIHAIESYQKKIEEYKEENETLRLKIIENLEQIEKLEQHIEKSTITDPFIAEIQDRIDHLLDKSNILVFNRGMREGYKQALKYYKNLKKVNKNE